MVAISQSHAGLFRRLAVALVDNHPRINQARITAATPWVGTRTLSPPETRMPAADSPSIPYFALVALQYPCSPTIHDVWIVGKYQPESRVTLKMLRDQIHHRVAFTHQTPPQEFSPGLTICQLNRLL